MTGEDEFDALIVGAGPAGLCMAAGLARAGRRVAVLERQPVAAIAEPAFDGREIALTHRSIHILKELGVWQLLPPAEIAPLKRARVMTGRHGYRLQFDQRETPCAALGYLVANHLIRKAAYTAATALPAISFLPERRLAALEAGATAVTLRTTGGEALRARWLVVADGRWSETRRALGIAADMLDFGRSMLVCRMRHDAPHEATAWEWFQDRCTMALLPLNGRESSVVITDNAAATQRLAELEPAAFEREVERRFDGALGAMQLSSTRHLYPLVATYARRFAREHAALIGDAAVGMHPVTAHGFNLGLQSAAGLLDELGRAAPLLSRYEAAHNRRARPLYVGTNAIVHLYSDARPAARVLRMAGLHVANRLRPFKRLVLSSLTEFESADLPATPH